MGIRKSRNSVAEVDLSAIRHNLEVLDRYLSPGVKQMAVVKAGAYGHGAVEVARAIEENVSWFAVNDSDEGIELRRGGISAPILVFGTPNPDTVPVYRADNLTATVSALNHFDLLPPGTKYHLNFDTGMGRLGFRPGEVESVKEAVEDHPGLSCTGIYSHFATADDPGSDKASTQLGIFKTIRSRFDHSLTAHMGNTGATAFYPDAHFDMVRNGIGIYGYAPGTTEIEGLKPALRWTSSLVQVKSIKKGETVSYGAQWRCPKDGKIAVIPVGYEEGVPRILTGKLQVSINKKLYPVAGTVTMNYVIAYLGSDSYGPGEHVDLLGGRSLTASDWAERAGTIPYEILTGISDRIERRYKESDVKRQT